MAIYSLYEPLLKAAEGGFQKIPSDSGNYNSLRQLVGTNRGISAKRWEEEINRPPTENDMRSITKDQAKEFFKVHYWDVCKADKIFDQYVANTIVDMHVNAWNGAELAQKVLNQYFGKDLVIDNKIGKNTLNALNSVNARAFVDIFNQERVKYYKEENNPEWLPIWLNRVKDFGYQNAKLFWASMFVIGFFLPIY